jgi:hypothetical protein
MGGDDFYKAFDVFSFGFHSGIRTPWFFLGLDGFQWVSKVKNGHFLGCWIVGFL